jgi:hypothetical protein
MAAVWVGVFVILGALAGAGVRRDRLRTVPATVPLIVAGLAWAARRPGTGETPTMLVVGPSVQRSQLQFLSPLLTSQVRGPFWFLGRVFRRYQEHRVSRCNRLECFGGCPPIDGNVRPGPRCALQVAAQDRSAAVYVNFLQCDRFPDTVTEHGTPCGRPYIAYPVGVLTEHGNQVPAAVVVGDDGRERDRLARATPGDFDRDKPARPGTGRREPCLRRVEQPGQTACSPLAIQPPSHRIRKHRRPPLSPIINTTVLSRIHLLQRRKSCPGVLSGAFASRGGHRGPADAAVWSR